MQQVETEKMAGAGQGDAAFGANEDRFKPKPPRRSTPTTNRGIFEPYKPEQGRGVRRGTFIAAAALVAWGWVFLRDQLSIYAGEGLWALFISQGIPMIVAVAAGAFAWWIVYGHRGASDFMIATEGEMKKVNWSTRREVIGSTKVVIIFTVLMAALLFLIDTVFMKLFEFIGVLKSGA